MAAGFFDDGAADEDERDSECSAVLRTRKKGSRSDPEWIKPHGGASKRPARGRVHSKAGSNELVEVPRKYRQDEAHVLAVHAGCRDISSSCEATFPERISDPLLVSDRDVECRTDVETLR